MDELGRVMDLRMRPETGEMWREMLWSKDLVLLLKRVLVWSQKSWVLLGIVGMLVFGLVFIVTSVSGRGACRLTIFLVF